MNQKHKAIIFIFIILTFYSSIICDYFPERYSGNKLVEDMNEYMKSKRGETFDLGKASFFMGYVIGIADGHDNLLFRLPDCSFQGDDCKTKLFDVVASYLYKNPMKWGSVSAEVLVREALQKAFPINK